MSNFYGGKEGRSFVIVKEYRTISEMVDNFKLGPSYTEVNFDEYVLINTVNKANPENGQLFRRGYDYDSKRTIQSYNLEEVAENDRLSNFIVRDMIAGGAIYVGTIVGPAGRAPLLHFDLYENVEKIERIAEIDGKINTLITDAELMIDYLYETYPEGYGTLDENGAYIDDDRILNIKWILYKTNAEGVEEQYYYYFHYDKYLYQADPEHSMGWYQVDTPPKTGEGSFHPETESLLNTVEYQYDDNGKLVYEVDDDGNKHLIIVGRQDTIDWTYLTVRNENNEDSTAHIGFKIPVTMVEYEAKSVSAYYNRNNETHIFDNLNLVERNQTHEEIENHPFYSKWQLFIPKGIKGDAIRGIRVIDMSTTDEQVVTLNLDSDGKIQYNEDGSVQTVDYVEADSADEDRCVFVYDYYNYERKEEGDHYVIYAGDFNILSKFDIGTDGTVERTYTHTDTIIQEHLIKWIDKVDFAEDGTITITFNNSSIHNGELQYPQLVNWITKFEVDKSTGNLVIEMNNDNLDFDVDAGAVDGKLSYPGYLKTVNRIEYEAETQRLRAYYNTSEDEYISDKFAFFMAAPDDSSEETTALQEELEVSGVWFITQEIGV